MFYLARRALFFFLRGWPEPEASVLEATFLFLVTPPECFTKQDTKKPLVASSPGKHRIREEA